MSAATSVTPGNPRWLFGPGSDLLLGCGVVYMGIFALLAAAGDRVEAAIPIASFMLISLVVSAPHYGATLLRVYERREDRRAYAVFAIYISALILALFVASLYSPWLGSLTFTLYLTWSPWHYSGQNYGLAVMFLRRRGVPLGPALKRLLYATFLLSYGIIFLTFHSGAGSAGYGQALPPAGGYHFVPLGIPAHAADLLLSGLAVAYGSALIVFLVLLQRVSRLRDQAPALLLMASQALWFALPGLARAIGPLAAIEPLRPESAAYVGLWIASAHAIQYLWVTTYYAARAESHLGRTRYLTKALLAGSAIWGLPALLFSPSLLGSVPYNLGLFTMVAATVNLHHFILDGAIWKLRDARIARILLRPKPAAGAGTSAKSGRRSFVGPLVWATGLACLLVSVFGALETQYGADRAGARGDAERLALDAKRLAWIGRDSPKLHHQLALFAERRGDRPGAEREYKAALAIYETKNVWHNLGMLYLGTRRYREALDAFEHALTLDPGLRPTLDQAATAALALNDRAGAARFLERAARVSPGDPALHRRLAQVRSESSLPADGVP